MTVLVEPPETWCCDACGFSDVVEVEHEFDPDFVLELVMSCPECPSGRMCEVSVPFIMYAHLWVRTVQGTILCAQCGRLEKSVRAAGGLAAQICGAP